MLIELFNLIEGFFWIGLGVWMVLGKKQLFVSNNKTTSGIISIIFGISDFVEMGTGAWWRPWWLLAWKGACVAVGLIILILTKGGSHEDNG